MADSEYNPRGIKRPHTGVGKGVGVGGRRDGRNVEPCPDSPSDSTKGQGQGEGKGKGTGRTR